MTKAIVVSGAAARGAFAAGVLSTLNRGGYAAIYGTSSGALNSTLFAFTGPEGTRKMWESIAGLEDAYEFNGLDALWLPGLYNSSPIYKKALAIISTNHAAMPVTVTVTNMKKGIVELCHYVPRDPLPPAMFASAVAQSATIPGLCCDKDDWDRVDGGIIMNLPMREAIHDGHDELTLILDQPYQETPEGVYDASSNGALAIIDEAVRALSMMFWAGIWNEIQDLLPQCKSLTVYAPQPGLLTADYMDFSHETIMKTMALGVNTKAQVIK